VKTTKHSLKASAVFLISEFLYFKFYSLNFTFFYFFHILYLQYPTWF
jgi:hypothetical protein